MWWKRGENNIFEVDIEKWEYLRWGSAFLVYLLAILDFMAHRKGRSSYCFRQTKKLRIQDGKMIQGLARNGCSQHYQTRFNIVIFKGVLVLISIFIFIVSGNYIKNSLQYKYSLFKCSFKIH